MKMIVNKEEFVNQMREKYHYTKNSALTAVNDIIDLIVLNMSEGNKVSFMGFGSFEVKDRKERRVHNPQSRQIEVIPATRVVKFSPGKSMKEAAVFTFKDEEE